MSYAKKKHFSFVYEPFEVRVRNQDRLKETRRKSLSLCGLGRRPGVHFYCGYRGRGALRGVICSASATRSESIITAPYTGSTRASHENVIPQDTTRVKNFETRCLPYPSHHAAPPPRLRHDSQRLSTNLYRLIL